MESEKNNQTDLQESSSDSW